MPTTLTSVVQQQNHTSHHVWVIVPAEATRWHFACQAVIHPTTFVTFLNCLPCVIWSVTNPVVLPSSPCCKCLLCAEMFRVWWSTLLISSWVLPDFVCPPLPKSWTSYIPPFIHPFDIYPSVMLQDWNHQSGLLEEIMIRRASMLQVLCRETLCGRGLGHLAFSWTEICSAVRC